MKKALLFVLVGAILMWNLLGCEKNYKNQKLTEYSYSSSGDMIGSSESTYISIINDEVYLTYTNSEAWYEDNTVTEYLIDQNALEEINRIFSKYRMYNWDSKKMSDMFVADGASYSHSFTFENGERISFSSQFYPDSYADKLHEIKALIKEYEEKGTLLPGLVATDITPKKRREIEDPQNGLVDFSVYEYSKNRIMFRIVNGTDETINLSETVVLLDSNGNKIAEDSIKYGKEVDSHSSESKRITLDSWLSEGTYTLTLGDCTTTFEIKKQGS